METIDVKGVRFRADGLAPGSRAYLEKKLSRIRRHERRERNPLHRLVEALLPRDWRIVPVESYARGRVLVVGCAGGIETLALGAVGLDVDFPALRVAADLASHADGASARFLAASGADLPFPDGAFDSVLSDNVVEHLPETILHRHFREVVRVLKPGGLYAFTTPNRLFDDSGTPDHVSLHTYGEWEAIVAEAGFALSTTPRRRSGKLEALSWKIRAESRARLRWGLSRRGLRMVEIVATAP